MPSGRFILFIVFDLVVLLLILLLTAYYGWSHVFLLLLGLILLALSYLDYSTGRISAVFALIFNLPASSERVYLNWLPVLLSLALVIYSFTLLFEHGLVNSAQRWYMQEGAFQPLALRAGVGALLTITAAVLFSVLSGRKR